MGSASFVQSSFVGGEWSQSAQGAIADPRYKVSLNICFNGFPTEPGPWTRRPGTRYCAHTRGGKPARIIEFDLEEKAPYQVEYTTNYARFYAGPRLATTNETYAVSAISNATPAVVTLASNSWQTGATVMFKNLGVNNPLLHNRQFIATRISATQLSLSDAITGSAIDGSTLGAFVSGNLVRIQEIATPYAGTDWQNLRCVQSQQTSLLLHGSYLPQVLSVTSQPTDTADAQFSLAGLTFLDGPYLDPPTNGVQVTPSAVSGIVQLTLAFPAYSSTQAYAAGFYVTSSSVNYVSLVDQNVGNTPASNPSKWAVANAAQSISPNGFVGSDIGRMVRLYSEPPDWAVGQTYTAATSIVKYNNAYYSCLTNNTATAANAPGASASTWGLYPKGAIWTWGKITSLLNQISQSLSGATNIGDMTLNGGRAAAFDGVINQTSASSAAVSFSQSGSPSLNATCYIGRNFSAASDQVIASATVFPSTDSGFGIYASTGATTVAFATFTFNLRGKSSAPSSSSDGVLLGSVSVLGALNAPATIVSNDQTTAWKYVWVECVVSLTASGAVTTLAVNVYCAELQLFAPAGSGTSTGVNVEILGPPLLYTTSMQTWRLGLYSGSTGYPTCGTYHEGRIWLSGSINNRIDGAVPNSLVNNTINFAPTKPDGTVTDASAISYTLSSPDANPIFAMHPDQQGIVCLTQAGEWLVQASSLNSPLTPTNIQAHRVTKVGSANILPVKTEHTILLVQKHKRRIMEFFADVFSGKFTAPNLSEKAKHIAQPGFAELAYQRDLTPILWARMNDGSLTGMTYKRERLTTSEGPTISGWHRHQLGSGRLVESINVGPNVDGTMDSLAMVTNDASTGVRHVEMLTTQFEEAADISTAWFLDDAITPSAYASAVVMGGASGINIYGLWHLNGKTVTAFCGGLDCGDWTVSNGMIQVPFAPSTKQTNQLFTQEFVSAYSGAMPIVVGFTYTSQGQLLRPDTQPEGGARNGPGFGKVRRIHRLAGLLIDTQAISFGTDFNRLNAAVLKTNGGTPIAANTLYTGIFKDAVNDDSEGYLSRLCWQVSRPFPATIAAIGGSIQTEDD